MKKKKRIGILTAGGDCPALNAVIRAVAKKAITDNDWEIIGINDGFDGLIHDRTRKLEYEDVSGILTLGGTILGTSNKANPYRYPVKKGEKLQFKDLSGKAIKNFKKLDLACLVCIGGDGTLTMANKLYNDGVPVVGIPKTIDNDLRGTDVSFGFDSAVAICTESIDRIHTTAESHHRIMIVEVMGRTAGWIALYAGVAGGGDIILIPEIPFDAKKIAEKVTERSKKGKRFSILVVAEGAKPKGGAVVVKRMVKESTIQVRLGGVGYVVAEKLEKITGLETRTTVLGHLQRGGSPTAFDRILATRLGSEAVNMIEREEFGKMIGVRGESFDKVPLDIVAQGPRTVPLDHELILAARSVGTYFGD